MELDIDKLDFDRCEEEPIHIPESIQGYGYLVALNPEDGRIRIFSENVSTLLSGPQPIIGRGFFELLDPEVVDVGFLREVHRRARMRGTRLPFQVQFRPEAVSPGQAADYHAIVYDSGGHLVMELEPAAQFRAPVPAALAAERYVGSIAPRLHESTGLEQMAQEMVEGIRTLTKMDRVVLYKFLEDGSGVVLAEARAEDIDSYLQLYFPSTDIPRQARELYKKNWVRLDPNVDLPSSPLIPTMAESGRPPLDLTHSSLRELSPIHRQYVRNQGLKASMSLSLLAHDKLWGIISCHHRAPCYVPQNVRLECENISQVFSWHLYAKEEELLLRKKRQTDQAIDQMLENVAPDESIIEIFRRHEQEVLRFLGADGFMFWMDTQVVSLGTVPDPGLAGELHQLARNRMGDPFLSTNIRPAVSDPAALNGLVGVLLIPLIEHRNYFTVWFRKEQRLIQKWVGNPGEKAAAGSKRERLAPRASFEVVTREITGQSKEWAQTDIDVAARFNRIFMAYALELQERMRKEVKSLERQDSHKNEFLATLAHELRNPLAPIRTGVAVLEQADQPEARNEIIAIIKRQVENMTTMIDDLMDLSRITRGKVNLQLSILELQAVIREAVETSTALIEQNRHSLHLDLPSDPLFVQGDRVRLAQVFTNILNNAAKYTDPGGRLGVSVEAGKEEVSIRFADDGIGIPQEDLEKIFTIFSQVEAHKSKAQGGLGIGLTLAHRLIDAQGGRISVRSEGPGTGSEFTVVLPLSQAVPAARAEARLELSPDIGARRRILVVDDNVDVARMYGLLLESAGFDVSIAHKPSEAIELFKASRPDFALLDIGLPEMDGFELCRALSALPEGEGTVFFSQSGWGNEEDFAEAHAAGFKRHFVKPFPPQRLFDALREAAPAPEGSDEV